MKELLHATKLRKSSRKNQAGRETRKLARKQYIYIFKYNNIYNKAGMQVHFGAEIQTHVLVRITAHAYRKGFGAGGKTSATDYTYR